MSESRALGALYGLAIGDALGMPTQTLSRERIAALFGTLDDFEPGPPENEISAGLPAGRVTDDTDQALIVARALIDGERRGRSSRARTRPARLGAADGRRRLARPPRPVDAARARALRRG